ncbi:MAG: EpsG family protein [Gammaproteobacteria bacterium]
MFVLSALAAFSARRHLAQTNTGVRSIKLDGAWIIAVFAMTLLIGFRIEVGADWVNYVRYVYDARYAPFSSILQGNDPGYQFLNWLSAYMNWDIYGVNLIGGVIFSSGLAVFCRSLPRPWLALAVAVPYLVIVVAMGYSRQGIALGLAMLGLVALGRRKAGWFVFWVVLGATFHKSAVILLPVAAMTATRNRNWTALWVGIAAVAAYFLLLEDSVDELRTNYLEGELFQSQGAMIRLLMNALPAGILLLWQRKFDFARAEALLWRWFAIISLVLLAVYLVTRASTAVDRVALYMLPLQLVVFSHLPDVLGQRGKRNEVIVAGVIFYYAAAQFVWLNFAAHSSAWLPYRFYPAEAWF